MAFYPSLFSSKTQIDSLPYAICADSKKPGKHIVFTVAVHGSEPSGVFAMEELLETIKLKNGKVTFILGNPEGFEKNQRFIDDNLNRVFDPISLQNPGNSIEKNRAVQIANWAKKQQIDLWVDFHSTSSSDEPMLVTLQEHNRVDDAIKITNFATHFVVSKYILSGSLMQWCEENNIPAFVLECGLHTSPLATKRALTNMKSILKFNNVIDTDLLQKEVEKLPFVSVYTAQSVLHATPGFTWKISENRITTGEQIAANELLATDEKMEYKYQTDQYLMMPDKNPKLGDTGIAFVCDLEVLMMVKFPSEKI